MKTNKNLARKLRLGKKTISLLANNATIKFVTGFQTSGDPTCPWSTKPICTTK